MNASAMRKKCFAAMVLKHILTEYLYAPILLCIG